MRTIYGSDLVLISFFNISMAVDILEAGEVTFTLVTNKKHKGNCEASSLLFMFFSNSRSKTLLISQALSFQSYDKSSSLKLVTTYSGSTVIFILTITISKTIKI